MMGPKVSDASGVVGDGEGDLEQAVVDEDDIGKEGKRREVSEGAKNQVQSPRSAPPGLPSALPGAVALT